MKDYDYLAPLACGDVVVEGVELTLHRDTPGALDRIQNDPSVQVGELSFSRYLLRLAASDRSLVGIPIFANRGFRHRCFYVRRNSGLNELKNLAGKRIGINDWPATGNTWSRAALREQGVRIEQIKWLVGMIDSKTTRRPQGTLPSFAVAAAPGRLLRDMLLEGELDALLCPNPPEGFLAPNSPIVRLFSDFRRVEQEYYRRTGIFPVTHILGIRREVFERSPWVVRNLYQAIEESKARWQVSRRVLNDTTPWIVADIEDAIALFGADWWPNGVEANRKAIQALCDEQLAQGLVKAPLDPKTAFADFEEVMGGGGAHGKGGASS